MKYILVGAILVSFFCICDWFASSRTQYRNSCRGVDPRLKILLAPLYVVKYIVSHLFQ